MFVLFRHGLRLQSPLHSFTCEVHQKQQNPNLEEDQKITMTDEIDVCVPGSRVLSESSDVIPQATYIVLSSDDVMQLTVTRSALDVLTDISEVR